MKRRIRRILLTPDFYVLPLLHFNRNYRLLDLSAPEDSLREMSVAVEPQTAADGLSRRPFDPPTDLVVDEELQEDSFIAQIDPDVFQPLVNHRSRPALGTDSPLSLIHI